MLQEEKNVTQKMIETVSELHADLGCSSNRRRDQSPVPNESHVLKNNESNATQPSAPETINTLYATPENVPEEPISTLATTVVQDITSVLPVTKVDVPLPSPGPSPTLHIQPSDGSDAKHSEAIENLQPLLSQTQERDATDKQLLSEVRKQLTKSEDDKTQIESQYRNLLGKVTQMKATLGERLKQDAQELASNRQTIEDLESQNFVLNETVVHMQEQIVSASESDLDKSRELVFLKDESQSLVAKLERLQKQLQEETRRYTEEKEQSSHQLRSWENIAVEEKTVKDSLRDRISDLEEQLSEQNAAYQKMRSQSEEDNQSISQFRTNIQELQEGHKKELREAVGTLQATIDSLTERIDLTKEREKSLLV